MRINEASQTTKVASVQVPEQVTDQFYTKSNSPAYPSVLDEFPLNSHNYDIEVATYKGIQQKVLLITRASDGKRTFITAYKAKDSGETRPWRLLKAFELAQLKMGNENESPDESTLNDPTF